ncbi:MAG: HAD family hydrolase [bacterium]
MTKTIFFDIYQTLLSVDDSGNDTAWNIFSDYFKNNGIEINNLEFSNLVSIENKKYYQNVGDIKMIKKHHNLFNSINTVFLNHGIKIEKSIILDLIWQFRKKYTTDLHIYPGVKDMLYKLSKVYTLSIASYTQSSYTYLELEKFKISQYFSHFIFSSDIGYRKTDPEFFKICLKETKNLPQNCIMIGDNYLQDIVTPKKVGFKAILIENPETNKKNHIKKIQPDGIVKLKNIFTLHSVIKSL